ncbi:MAG: PDZ domain-containing protein, partial [Proteobacteria bacterium]|nr:PDZ domain-containing protein [Pseudomonadota bacterium]
APPAARPEPPKPRLGVIIRGGDGGVRVIEVVAESVAEAAGIRKGDLIVEAAGVAVADNAGLIAVVQRQAPGTWLPLAVERGGERLDIVARFAPGP